jgi:hypothetical protein
MMGGREAALLIGVPSQHTASIALAFCIDFDTID